MDGVVLSDVQQWLRQSSRNGRPGLEIEGGISIFRVGPNDGKDPNVVDVAVAISAPSEV
jgi:hypothetical protein